MNQSWRALQCLWFSTMGANCSYQGGENHKPAVRLAAEEPGEKTTWRDKACPGGLPSKCMGNRPTCTTECKNSAASPKDGKGWEGNARATP